MEEKRYNSENELIETAAPADEPTVSSEDLHGENLTDRVRVLSPGMIVAKRFFRSKLSIIGLVTLIFLFLFSFVGPLLSPWEGDEPDLTVKTQDVLHPSIGYEIDGEKFKAFDIYVQENDRNKEGDISWTHWLGTDENGFDIFTRLMLGGRISLTIGFVVIILETLIGVTLGGIAGYFGGWVDQVIMRIVDILYCIPSLPIMLILSALLDSLEVEGIARLYYLMAILTLLGWSGTARLVRGQILSLREQDRELRDRE